MTQKTFAAGSIPIQWATGLKLGRSSLENKAGNGSIDILFVMKFRLRKRSKVRDGASLIVNLEFSEAIGI